MSAEREIIVKTQRVRLTPKETLAALAVGLAFGLAGCGTTGAAPEPSTPEPTVSAAVTGEAAYLDAAEAQLDRAIEIDGSFEQFPEMRAVALDVAATSCDLQAEGLTDAEMYDRLGQSGADEKVLAVLRYWITAATTYVC